MLEKRIKNLYVVNPQITGKDVIFYGGGIWGHELYRRLVINGTVNLVGIYDNNLRPGTKIFDTRILSREELEGLDRDIPVLIAAAPANVKAFQEIARDLLELDFHNIITGSWPALPIVYNTEYAKSRLREAKDRISLARNLLADERSVKVFDHIIRYRLSNEMNLFWEICERESGQYFPGADIFVPSKEEVFIDGGCLNTATIKALKHWTSDTYTKVFAFEPSEKDKMVCDEYISFYKYRAECINAGLYNKSGKIGFSIQEFGSSRIDEVGEATINVVTLDEFMKDRQEKVTFIKMDIEGSELEALEGSVGRIASDHPKLAICVYHKFSDLWELLLWIHERFPGYQFYLRHYSMTNNETVLYARWDG